MLVIGKVSLLLGVSISILINAFSQFDSLERQYFNNDSIRYELRFRSYDLNENHSRHSKYFIRVRLPDIYRNYLLSKDSTYWLNRLTDTKNDWAANLLLFNIYYASADNLISIKLEKVGK